MQEISVKEAFVKLHISVLLAGLTGLFGKLVHLHQLSLVFWRISLALAVLLVVMTVRRSIMRIPLRSIIRISGVGVLLALHWVFFFGSIKASNVSVGVVCYSLVGVFTALIEPWVMHTRLSVRDILLSLITVAGIMLIFNFDAHYRYGIMLGVVSSIFASLFTIFNKKVVDGEGVAPATMLLYELIAGVAVIALVLCLTAAGSAEITIVPSMGDFLWLLVLASACTIGLQLLQIDALKRLSAFTVNLTYNLEPVYTIIIALTLLHEARQLSWAFYTGLALIILSVGLKTLLIMRNTDRNL